MSASRQMPFPAPHNNVCLQSFANDFQEKSVNDGSAFVTLLYSAHETVCLSVSFPDEKSQRKLWALRFPDIARKKSTNFGLRNIASSFLNSPLPWEDLQVLRSFTPVPDLRTCAAYV